MKTKKTVLVVDDDPACIEILTDLLEDEGFAVLTAGDGDAGLKAARASKPDVVVLDVQMPGKDGFTAFAELRKDKATQKLPVIFLTGMGQVSGIGYTPESLNEYFGEKPEAYIEKPIDPERLISAVRKAAGPA